MFSIRLSCEWYFLLMLAFVKIWEGTPCFFFGPMEVMDAMSVYLSCSPVFNVFPDLFRVRFGRGGL